MCVTDNPDGNTTIKWGFMGTIVSYRLGTGLVGVRFDTEIIGGHDLNGACEDGYGWFVEPKDLRKIEDEDIPCENIATETEILSMLGILS